MKNTNNPLFGSLRYFPGREKWCCLDSVAVFTKPLHVSSLTLKRKRYWISVKQFSWTNFNPLTNLRFNTFQFSFIFAGRSEQFFHVFFLCFISSEYIFQLFYETDCSDYSPRYFCSLTVWYFANFAPTFTRNFVSAFPMFSAISSLYMQAAAYIFTKVFLLNILVI